MKYRTKSISQTSCIWRVPFASRALGALKIFWCTRFLCVKEINSDENRYVGNRPYTYKCQIVQLLDVLTPCKNGALKCGCTNKSWNRICAVHLVTVWQFSAFLYWLFYVLLLICEVNNFVDVYSRWLFGYLGCQWYGFNGMLFGFSSIGMLTVISVDRYICVVQRDRGKSKSCNISSPFEAVNLSYHTSIHWKQLVRKRNLCSAGHNWKNV